MRLDRAGSSGLHVGPLRFGSKIYEKWMWNVTSSRRCLLLDLFLKNDALTSYFLTCSDFLVAQGSPGGAQRAPQILKHLGKYEKLAPSVQKGPPGGPGVPF